FLYLLDPDTLAPEIDHGSGLHTIALGDDDLLAHLEAGARGAQEPPDLRGLPARERAATRSDDDRSGGRAHDPVAFLSTLPSLSPGASSVAGTAATGDSENNRCSACTSETASSGSSSRSAVI